MKVAVVDEGFQVYFDGTAGTRESVMNERGVFAVNHPNAFFEQGIVKGVGPNGSTAFETETLDELKALWVDGAAGPAVGCERIRGTAISDGFIERRDELIAAKRRLKSSDKKSVIAARHACRDRSRCEAAGAVGNEPLPRFGSKEIAADLASKLNLGLGLDERRRLLRRHGFPFLRSCLCHEWPLSV